VNCAGGLALVACAFASDACAARSGGDCEAIALVCDKTTITLTSPNDAWTPGMYTLALTTSGTQAHCTVAISAPPPSNGIAGLCPLDGTFTLKLVTVDSCPPVVCNSTACTFMSCTPIPDHFQMTLVIQGMPTKLGLSLSRDGNALMSQTIAPKETRTGSATCGTCTNASATVSVAGG
jgi:hypothetical protein